MEVKTVTSTHYVFSYNGTKISKNVKKEKIPINDTDVLEYNKIIFDGYESVLMIEKGKLRVKFGCLTLNEDDIIRGYKQILGEPTFTMKRGLKRKGSNKTMTTNIIDESNKFYISSSNRAYSKKEYEIKEYKYDPKIIKFEKRHYYNNSGNGWKIKDRKISSKYEMKDEIIKCFEYYIEIITLLKQLKNNKN